MYEFCINCARSLSNVDEDLLDLLIYTSRCWSASTSTYLSLAIATQGVVARSATTWVLVPESGCSSGSWRFSERGSPSGEELEGESPRGGDRVPGRGKPPYNFGAIFEKHVVLKSLSESSDGKKELVSHFFEL